MTTRMTKNQLVKLTNIPRTSLYRQFEKPPLSDAVLPNGQVSLDHPAVRELLADHGVELESDAIPSRILKGTLTTRDFHDLTVRELLAAGNGDLDMLKELAQIAKHISTTETQQFALNEKRREFIHVQHVQQLVTHVDALQKALLTDAVKNMATRSEAQFAAGESRREVESAMRNVISRTIKATKSELERRLRE